MLLRLAFLNTIHQTLEISISDIKNKLDIYWAKIRQQVDE